MFKNFDFLILFFVLIIATLGLAVIWSVAPDYFSSQVIFFLIGFLLFSLFSLTNYRIFANYAPHLYVVSLFLLFLPFIFGQVTRGSVRWVQVGPLTLQPSEVVKPLLILFFANFLSKRDLALRSKLQSLIFLLPIVFLVFKQPDLGSAAVVAVVWVGILLASGISLRLIFSFCLLLLGLSPLFWRFLEEYQKTRILSFLNPYSDPLGAGYNLIQSVIAVGAGRFFGKGLGRGTQSHLDFLPERHTDFIFASLAEEFGFFGGLLLLVFFFFLFFRILRIARQTTDPFGSLIAVGVFVYLFFQVFVNVGMNLGIVPITGITLPLMSAGGSSILAIMISLGLVESVARNRKLEGEVRIR